jgi:hypothetical protein
MKNAAAGRSGADVILNCRGMSMRNARILLPLLAALLCAPALADFQDRGMRDGRLRTDLDPGKGAGPALLNLQYREPLDDGCQFSVLDPLNLIFGCPGLKSIRAKADGSPGFIGLQLHPSCGSSATALGPAMTAVGNSWLGCVSYPSSPYYSLNQPASQYWVVVANSDPSFDQCNDGPPGLSHAIRDPIDDPGPSLYKVGMERLPAGGHRAHLIINAGDHPFRCERPGYKQGPHAVIPFLSLGAHAGHGQAGPVATMNRDRVPASRPRLRWTAWTLAHVPFGCDPAKGDEACFAEGVQAGFYGIASWDGVKRLLFVNLLTTGDLARDEQPPSRLKWNWPLADSFYYPGAEVITFSSAQLARLCGIDVPRQSLQVGQQQYGVDITAVFGCASDQGLFSSPMPRYSDVDLDGFHWYLEAVGSTGALWIAVEDPRVD